ncbi:glycoside hydrolase superfamily, partial [Mycena rosella]
MSSTALRSSQETPYAYTPVQPASRPKNGRRRILIGIVVAVLVVVVAVVLAVYFTGIRPKHDAKSSSSSSGPGSNWGDGSTVTTENGTQFTYNNTFGGFCNAGVDDPSNPFNNNAKPNSWTPPLNTSWTWGVDRIYGVNLGGLFVMEPFITPSYYERYSPTAIDEWTLSVAMANDTANGGLGQLETHYDTFITEEDIAEIAGAGLNWLRIPIPFWAIETWPGEPFLAKTSWKYFLRVLGWARKYGLRVCLDLHTVPGLNHSGRGNMGLANAERTLYYIRVLTEFISQPAYRDLIPIFGIVNEALLGIIGKDQLTSFYLEAHTMIRGITGYGEGNGPYIAIHDGFQSLASGLISSKDTAPIAVNDDNGNPGGKWPTQACNAWGSIHQRQWAASPNDCGYFLRGYDDYLNYNESMVAGINDYVLASMDATGDWFFWTWKIGPNQAGAIGSHLGWIPADPRTAIGKCQALGLTPSPFNGTYAPWATGGATSSIPASSSASFPWPPTTISNAVVPVTLMPTYTSTGSIITMPPATFTAAPSSVTASVNGWLDAQDTAGGVVTVAGCTYPDEYNGIFR